MFVCVRGWVGGWAVVGVIVFMYTDTCIQRQGDSARHRGRAGNVLVHSLPTPAHAWVYMHACVYIINMHACVYIDEYGLLLG